jgi:hypothetical protein
MDWRDQFGSARAAWDTMNAEERDITVGILADDFICSELSADGVSPDERQQIMQHMLRELSQ